MLCSFVKKKREWICENCGRRVLIDNDKIFQPSAKCRIPNKLNQNIHKSYNEFYEQKSDGVGTCLVKILKKINIEYDEKCKCKSKIDLMDYNGIEWCEKNISSIQKWIKNECEQRNIVYLSKTVKALIKLAIKKSKNNKN